MKLLGTWTLSTLREKCGHAYPDADVDGPSVPECLAARVLLMGLVLLLLSLRLMIQILHYLSDPRLWELWYIPYYLSS